MTVRAILDSKGHQVQSVESETTLSAAIKMLAERKIGALLVMSKGRLDGILSERDVVRVLGDRGAAALDEPVDAVMTRKVVSCRPSDTVASNDFVDVIMHPRTPMSFPQCRPLLLRGCPVRDWLRATYRRSSVRRRLRG